MSSAKCQQFRLGLNVLRILWAWISNEFILNLSAIQSLHGLISLKHNLHPIACLQCHLWETIYELKLWAVFHLCITVTPHECHGVWNHHANRLFVKKVLQANCKENIKAKDYWFFVWGTNLRWVVDSPHKGPVMWKESPCHDVFMLGCHIQEFHWAGSNPISRSCPISITTTEQRSLRETQ